MGSTWDCGLIFISIFCLSSNFFFSVLRRIGFHVFFHNSVFPPPFNYGGDSLSLLRINIYFNILPSLNNIFFVYCGVLDSMYSSKTVRCPSSHSVQSPKTTPRRHPPPGLLLCQ